MRYVLAFLIILMPGCASVPERYLTAEEADRLLACAALGLFLMWMAIGRKLPLAVAMFVIGSALTIPAAFLVVGQLVHDSGISESLRSF